MKKKASKSRRKTEGKKLEDNVPTNNFRKIIIKNAKKIFKKK